MPKFGSEEDYKKKQKSAMEGGDLGTLPEEEYVFEIIDWDVQERTAHPKYNPEGYPAVRLYLQPIALADDSDSPLRYIDGKPVGENKYILFWINTNGDENKPRLGFGPSGPSNARRLIWAAYGVPVKQPLDFEWDDLIGKRLIGSTSNKTNAEGKTFENIETVRQFKGKVDRSESRTTRRPTAVDAAKEVFAGDIDEEDQPF
jgi:hypothetical protein